MVKILLVEDHEDVREALHEVLEQDSHDVTEAGDGLQAEALLKNHDYDIMITDIMMPNKTGFDLIDGVRDKHPAMKIIAISGGGNYLTSELTTHLAQLRAEKSIAKPFMPQDILDAVNDLIQSNDQCQEH